MFELYFSAGGLSGLVSSLYLSDAGFDVTLFEKEKIGGRVSSIQNGNLTFDVGAQYFTIRNENFSNFLEEFKNSNVIAEWKPKNYSFENKKFLKKDGENIQRFVGIPCQQTFIKHVEETLKNVKIKKQEIKQAEFEVQKWNLFSNDNVSEGTFDFLIFAGLAPELIKNILLECHQMFKDKFSLVEISSCECLMIAFETSLNINLDSCFINDSKIISWISNESSKPYRNSEHECWVVHSTKDFKSKNILEDLYNEFTRILSIFDENVKFSPVFKQIYSWKYAAVPKSLNDGFLFDDGKNFGICADWCSGSRIEGAFMSSYELSKYIIEHHTDNWSKSSLQIQPIKEE